LLHILMDFRHMLLQQCPQDFFLTGEIVVQAGFLPLACLDNFIHASFLEPVLREVITGNVQNTIPLFSVDGGIGGLRV